MKSVIINHGSRYLCIAGPFRTTAADRKAAQSFRDGFRGKEHLLLEKTDYRGLWFFRYESAAPAGRAR